MALGLQTASGQFGAMAAAAQRIPPVNHGSSRCRLVAVRSSSCSPTASPALGDSAADDAPDAVVIGAGHNGLVAANLLADAGWDVVVCEATEHLGGAVRSAEVTSPGYLSDLFSAFYPLSAASPVLRALELDRYGLHWTHAPSVLAHVFPDDRCAVLSRDLDQTAASVAEFAAGDGAAWRQLVGRMGGDPAAADRRPVHPAAGARAGHPAAGPARRRRCAADGPAGPAAGPPARRGAVRRARARRCCWPATPCTPTCRPRGPAARIYGWLLAMLGQSYGFPVPVGGAGMLTQSLATRLAARGGTIRLASPGRVDRGAGRHRGGRPAGLRRADPRPGARCWPT